MQWSRFIIAAVFFVLGAGIAIPALLRSNDTPSQASSAPTTSAPATSAPRTPSGTLSPARNGAPTPATPTATATATAPRRTPSSTPTRPGPTPTRTTPRPTATATASATPSRTGTTTPAPAAPLTTSVGLVRCPARSVTVNVKNVTRLAVDYSIEQDGTPTVADRIGPGTTRTSRLTLKEDDSTTIAVVWTNKTLRSVKRTANCTHREPAPAPAPPRRNLPHTGPNSAAVVAKVATGAAAMITGLVIFWYGGIWPRRRDQVLPIKK
jgi:hypothetical protein